MPMNFNKAFKIRNSWMQEITNEMREKGIKNLKWIDEKECRRKIKLSTQKDVKTFDTQYIRN